MNQTIVLRGTGPQMKVNVSTPETAKVLIVSRNKAQMVKVSKTTNVKFAA